MAEIYERHDLIPYEGAEAPWTGTDINTDVLSSIIATAEAVQSADVGTDSYNELQTTLTYVKAVEALGTAPEDLVEYAQGHLLADLNQLEVNNGCLFGLQGTETDTLNAGFQIAMYGMDDRRRWRYNTDGTVVVSEGAGQVGDPSWPVAQTPSRAFRFVADFRNVTNRDGTFGNSWIYLYAKDASNYDNDVFRIRFVLNNDRLDIRLIYRKGSEYTVTLDKPYIAQDRAQGIFDIFVDNGKLTIKDEEGTTWLDAVDIQPIDFFFVVQAETTTNTPPDLEMQGGFIAIEETERLALFPGSESLCAPNATDKTQLQAAVDKFDTLTESDYTPESWADYAGTVQSGQSVLDDPEASQNSIDEAVHFIDLFEQLLITISGCQFAFNGDDTRPIDLSGMSLYQNPVDSSYRRIYAEADGTAMSAALVTPSSQLIDLSKNWLLTLRLARVNGVTGANNSAAFKLALYESNADQIFKTFVVDYADLTWRLNDSEGQVIGSESEIIELDVSCDGTSVSLHHGATLLDQIAIPEGYRCLRMVAGITKTELSAGYALFYMDMLTNVEMGSVCDGLYDPDNPDPDPEDPEYPDPNEVDMGGIDAILNDYARLMRPRHPMPVLGVVKQHLALMWAFRLALGYDDRNTVTEAMDKIRTAFSDGSVPSEDDWTVDGAHAFQSKFTQRYAGVMCALHPVEAKIYLEFLRTTYETIDGVVPGWLQCNEDSICSCLPEDLAMRYLDYLKHL